jgi:hypothetical protein
VRDRLEAGARQLLAKIGRGIPGEWDGKEAITYLKNRDYQWRQMEWIGWYFERRAKDILEASGLPLGTPFRHGSVQFDIALDGMTFDIKTHVTKHPRDWVVLNDREAIEACLQATGSWGAILACGSAEMDPDGSFKDWHAALKGVKSVYEVERVRRGAPSRRRKTIFRLEGLIALCLDSTEALHDAYREGWMKDFQTGMRNAGGARRRAKIQCDLSRSGGATLGRLP